jgi:AraC-like DNA-binding protein
MSGRLRRIDNWEHLAKEANFKPGTAAALCGVSNRQLERFFLATFDQTPRQWMRELQCRLARELISRGFSNKAVVTDLQFSNPGHFCREFKKVFGSSPQSCGPIWRGRT